MFRSYFAILLYFEFLSLFLLELFFWNYFAFLSGAAVAVAGTESAA
jgi:hypothetical protein